MESENAGLNIFEEEFEKVKGGRDYLVLSEVLKISMLDDNNEFKINFAHIRKNRKKNYYNIKCLINFIYSTFILARSRQGRKVYSNRFRKFI